MNKRGKFLLITSTSRSCTSLAWCGGPCLTQPALTAGRISAWMFCSVQRQQEMWHHRFRSSLYQDRFPDHLPHQQLANACPTLLLKLHQPLHKKRLARKNSKRQAQQADGMKKRHAKTVKSSGVGPGAIVSVKNDYRDISHAHGTIGVVTDCTKSGGVKICTQWRVITQGVAHRDY